MAKLLSIFLICFSFQMLFFEAYALSANTFSLKSISIEGNKRISDEAIYNYSRLQLNEKISSEDLNTAYKNIYDTGLFKNVEFKQSNAGLTITIEEYPTISEISFEGNKKFTDEKLSSFVESKSRFVLSPFTLGNDVEELQKVYRNSGRVSARIKPK